MTYTSLFYENYTMDFKRKKEDYPLLEN